MNFFSHFPSLVKEVFEAINKHGKAYIVGGFVRDFYLGMPHYRDIDVEIYGIEAEKLENILSEFSNVNFVGKSFGVYKIEALSQFDFALARTEKKNGHTHQQFEITLDKHLTFKQASLRRDLTINAMLFDPFLNECIDPYGGLEDLKSKQLKAVNLDTFKEDPLRVLRVARFLAKLPDFKVDEDLKLICQTMSKDLNYLSQERIYEEYCQILMSTMPSCAFEFLKEINALPDFLKQMTNTMQRLDFHPEGSVFNHTMLVIDLAAICKKQVDRPLYFMWAALLHDIGKIKVSTPEGKAPNHDLVGETMAQTLMFEISRDKKLTGYVSILVRTHMALMVAMKKDDDLPYLRVLKRIDGICQLNDLLLLSKCDKLGRKRQDYITIEKFDAYIKKMKETYGSEAIKPIINGHDLIENNFNMKQKYKQILDEAYTLQLKGYLKDEIIQKLKQKHKG